MLQALDKEIHAFKKKQVMSLEDMKKNLASLNQITLHLEEAITELEVRGINTCSHPFNLKTLK